MPEVKENVQLLALDEAVEEVFRVMMNVACEPVESSSEPASLTGEIMTAVVGMAGVLSGTFVLRMEEAVALGMAELLTGMEFSEIDGTVNDALGEVCNMLVGAWKGKTPALASACMLSVPTIVSGTSYHIYTHRAPLHLERSFAFQGRRFWVSILGDSALE
ncbi:MAG TPA: chemotaxis protein CheX [Acidisarcina sp.]|nr:chemotaxis protein CheX [Acidisarcina sp.]